MLKKLYRTLNRTLRARLLATSVLPLLIALPLLLATLLWIGNTRTDLLLEEIAASKLASARNYLGQLKSEAGIRVSQITKSERLLGVLLKTKNREELEKILYTTARSNGFDFLIAATPDGRALASSEGIGHLAVLPGFLTFRQAGLGMSNVSYENISVDELSKLNGGQLSTSITNTENAAHIPKGSLQSGALLITASAHLPLSTAYPDTVLIAGIILNGNIALIERMRNVVFPAGSSTDEQRGETTIFLGDIPVISTFPEKVSVSKGRLENVTMEGTTLRSIREALINEGRAWFGPRTIGNDSYFTAYEPLLDSTGSSIGMISIAFSEKSYRKTILILVVLVSAAFTVLVIAVSYLFLKFGSEIQNRLLIIIDAMNVVGKGKRGVRVNPDEIDEIGLLARNFNSLLKKIEDQEEKLLNDQKVIKEEADRRKTLFENERDGVVVLDPEGNVFDSNSKFKAMFGQHQQEVTGDHISDWVIDLSRDEIMQRLDNLEPSGLLLESSVRDKTGIAFDAEISLSPASWGGKKYFLVTHRDISERKRNLNELENYRLKLEELVEKRTSELNFKSGQLEAIFEISPDGLVSFDQDHHVSFANRAFFVMTGLTEEKIIGKTQSDFLRLLSHECEAFPKLETIGFTEKTYFETAGKSATLKSPSGTIFTFDISRPSKSRIQMSSRNPKSLSISQTLYFRDVTHQAEIDRMKSEFLSTAAHELRTPMTSIQGFSEVLLTQNLDEKTRKDLLETIFRQAGLISSIINELLDLARIEARQGKDFKIKKLSLKNIVTQVLASYKIPSGYKKPIVIPTVGELNVMADAGKMQQALNNIVSNAYKYMPGKGSVTINFKEQQKDNCLYYGVTVEDEGIGMNPEQQKRACERFYRADSSGKIPGTGLGLSIVKEIVELHGGAIEIESVLGKGSKITLWIPAC